eukprot:7716726-Heterocapsa_arctica.AAC.1
MDDLVVWRRQREAHEINCHAHAADGLVTRRQHAVPKAMRGMILWPGSEQDVRWLPMGCATG